MITAVSILAFLHVLGAALGTAGITFAEIFYLKATADGRIDARERDYIRSTFFALKWGMLLALLSGIALGVFEYVHPEALQRVLLAPWWFANTLALVIIFAGWALAHKKVRWWFGSSIAFSGWWMMLMLDAWQIASSGASLSYLSLVAAYLVFAAIVAAVLSYARFTLAHAGKAPKV